MSERPYHSFRHPDFRRLWISQLVSRVGSEMQVVALNWHVYLLTHSALALGFVGLTRVVPIVLFSLAGGVVADRYDRRRILLASQIGMASVALVLAVITASGGDRLWMIYALNALQASASAFENPARQALVPRLVPLKELPGALSLNLTAFHVAMTLGPGMAGLLIAGTSSGLHPDSALATAAGAGGSLTFHLAALYALNAISFGGVILTLLRLDPRLGRPDHEDAVHEPPLDSLRTGLRFVFTTPIMVWTMGLDFFATFFSGALSLLPIVADQLLGVGPAGYGWLVSAPAVGALLGSFYISLRPLPKRQGVALLAAVVVYGMATVVWGLSSSFWLTLFALGVTGLADLVSTVVRQTMRQMLTPDNLRGRMTAVNMIFFMGGPQLGELEAGIVASLFASAATGIAVSVVSGGVATAACALFVAWRSPLVRDYALPPH